MITLRYLNEAYLSFGYFVGGHSIVLLTVHELRDRLKTSVNLFFKLYTNNETGGKKYSKLHSYKPVKVFFFDSLNGE